MDSMEQQMMDAMEEEFFGVRLTYPSTISFGHHFSVNEGFCCCMYDYLTYNNEEWEPTGEDKIIRRLIHHFKKGNASKMCAALMFKAIKEDPMLGYIPEDTVLAVIPASTAEKHKKRFEEFCRLLSTNLGVINGYPLLQVSVDSPTDTERKHRSRKDCIALSDPEGLLAGRHVLLIDDVYTTGRSYATVATLLKEAGAKSVTGLFLALSVPHTRYKK